MSPRKLHYLSGIIISLFAAMHLYNHICGIDGAERHIQMMDSLRLIYRNTFAEILLMIAIAVQVVTGLKFFKASRKVAVSFYDKLQIWSGLYLAMFFVIHVSAIMAGRYILKLETNYYFGAAGLNIFPFFFFFIPYYSLAIMALFGHIASIHSKKMKLTFWNISPGGQSVLILILGVLVTLATMFGMTNQFQGVDIPKEYHVILGK